jgi:hypothetical protein
MNCESKTRRQTGVARLLSSLLVYILKTVVERVLCGLLQYMFKKYFRQIDFQDIYFKEFKEKSSKYIS